MSLRSTTVQAGEELLPGYVVVELLRRGRRLDTYSVYSVARDCLCVVKALRPERRDDVRAHDQLMQEGLLLRDLTHPHLLRAYEVHETPLPAIVLETVGGDMLSAVVEDAALSVADAAQLGLQLTSALGYLHRQGWLHLDVKPSNVAVSGGRAVLMDLSLAGRPGSGRAGAGTPGYLAPEQAAGEGLSPASDVWGLGVTLGECVTGLLPYGDEATWHGGRQDIALDRGFGRRLRRMPVNFASLVEACLSTDPAGRPSLGEVRDVLRTFTSYEV